MLTSCKYELRDTNHHPSWLSRYNSMDKMKTFCYPIHYEKKTASRSIVYVFFFIFPIIYFCFSFSCTFTPLSRIFQNCPNVVGDLRRKSDMSSKGYRKNRVPVGSAHHPVTRRWPHPPRNKQGVRRGKTTRTRENVYKWKEEGERCSQAKGLNVCKWQGRRKEMCICQREEVRRLM